MTILMISHYAGAPQYGMEFRSYYMAREWVAMGHRVMIVGSAFSHLRKQQPAAGRETIDGIEYLWLPARSYEGNGAARALSMFRFVWQVYRNMQLWDDLRPDMVIASSVYTFDIYPCRRIARRNHARLVYEVHDLWPLSPMIIGHYSRWHPFIWLLQRGENYAYRHCDMVVSILDKAFPHMQRHGLSADRFCCIPNGYRKEEWNPMSGQTLLPEKHTTLLNQLKEQGCTIVGFAGGHTQSTAMHVLVEAANLLRTRHDIAFVLVGQGPLKEELIALAQMHQLDNIHFLPPIEKRAIPELLDRFDICYAGGVHSILHQYGTSFNKITDYMVAGKPIVNSVDEPGSMIERVGCGLQVAAERPDQVAKAVAQLADMPEAERTAMGILGRDYALQNLEYKTLAQRFIDAVIK